MNQIGDILGVRLGCRLAGSSSGGNDIGHTINTVTSCEFISNSVGFHANLSPDAEPPGVVGCRFIGNTKIGCNTPACVAMRCD